MRYAVKLQARRGFGKIDHVAAKYPGTLAPLSALFATLSRPFGIRGVGHGIRDECQIRNGL